MGDPIEAKSKRYSAAAELLGIVRDARDGEEIIAREFVKNKSRQDIGSLLKLSDDHLEELGAAAVYPNADPEAMYKQLLSVVLMHSNEASFIRTIRAQLREGMEGTAAVLYVATARPQRFFDRIGIHVIANFCNRAIRFHAPFCPKWYCAVKLLCMILKHRDPIMLRDQALLASLLSITIDSFIEIVAEEWQTEVSSTSEYQFVFYGLPILPLIAGCCEGVLRYLQWEGGANSGPLKSFLELLIRFVCRLHLGPRRLNAEGGLGIYVLTSFFKVPLVIELFVETELSGFASFLVDIMLHPWTVDRGTDDFEKDILKPLAAKEDLCLTCLCSLPGSTFSGALSGALKEGMLKLDSPNPNPYEPLGLVERLLWLSNVKMNEEQIHLALIGGRAWELLARALKHTGSLDPDDRGLWRAKGLAMTCLGNIIERMDKEQLCDCVQEEMIACVVAIKEDATVPLVQKGQAIFLLQRYTLAADRLRVQPFHREDTSNMAEEYRNANPDDTGSH
ncbi:hypothetical protein FRC00_001081 [Tulasnella sp. 408]|nr:hypothetical protein FRC00_001081 [Tulasnella sp. 408]